MIDARNGLFSRLQYEAKPLNYLGIVLVLLLLLVACDKSSEDSTGIIELNTGRVLLPFPPTLDDYLSANSQLKAYLRIDDGPQLALQVDRLQRQVRGSTGALTPGVHVVSIEYFVQHPDIELAVRVASAQTDIEIIKNKNVAVDFDHYSYFDDDNDGITNIAELQLGWDSWSDTSKTIPIGPVQRGGTYRIQVDPPSYLQFSTQAASGGIYRIE
ncbi:MAG: hypothetical protein OEZ58_08015 [Gammaproteobacteria bacterium]|nr:hypothetical protein [Gammaproteobacteria bacterium]MDH5728922.1 hypothetical protein [Gammaproteobacteria bacterium]